MDKLKQQAGLHDYERSRLDTLAQLAKAKTANSDVKSKPASLEDCKRLGIEVAWFVPAPKAKQDLPRVHINAVGVIVNARCRALMGEVPLAVDIAKQGKGFLVLRFSEQGKLAIVEQKGALKIKRKGLAPWLEAQGVPLGSYPVEWDTDTKCLYLRIENCMPKAAKARATKHE